MKKYFFNIRYNWKTAWSSKNFRYKILVGLFLNIIVLACLPDYFNYIQNRNGILMNDWIVKNLPAYNVSLSITLCICFGLLLFIYRAIIAPGIFMPFVFSYLFLTVSRMTMIYFVPLNPPAHLIILNDPISNLLYFGGFKTKDLFFSGHVSTICLIGLSLTKKRDKLVMLAVAVLLGGLLIIQHIHYTIDIVAAPFFAYGSCFLGKALNIQKLKTR